MRLRKSPARTARAVGHTNYLDDMSSVLATIFNATLDDGDGNDWKEVNGLQYLYRGGKTWTRF